MGREFIENLIIKCVQCGEDFIWYWREQLEMRQREERMRLTDTTATLPAPKRCRVCRMRRYKERQSRDKFLEVKQRDDARIKAEIDRERHIKLLLSGDMTKVRGDQIVVVTEMVSVRVMENHG